MNGKTIIFGLLLVGISFIWDSFGLPYNYIVALVGTAIIFFGLLSKQRIA